MKGGAGKHKHWGTMQREGEHSTTYSFFLTTVRGGCLITKGEKQEGFFLVEQICKMHSIIK